MKSLVTGASGFVGSAVVGRLLANGERDVRCLVRPASNRSRLETVQKLHGADLEMFVGSLASIEDTAGAIDGVDVIYHLAAAMSGPAADMFLNTVVTSKNLLEAVIRNEKPIKIVLVSSFGVYGVADLPKGHIVNENTPIEAHPQKRDLYSQTKLRQERLFWDVHASHRFTLTVLRPGVIYGPGGNAFSSRVGMNLFGVFVHLGADNLLPLSYVDNCAEAIVVAGRSHAANGQIYNVHDDDLPTCKQYLLRYKRQVKSIRSISIPYPLLSGISKLVERYHVYSKGQLPAIFTPYKTATTWKGNRFDNSKIKSLGWKQVVSTEEGLQRTFAHLKAQER